MNMFMKEDNTERGTYLGIYQSETVGKEFRNMLTDRIDRVLEKGGRIRDLQEDCENTWGAWITYLRRENHPGSEQGRAGDVLPILERVEDI